MPLYSVQCARCGSTDQVWRKIPDRDNLPICECGGALHRILEAPSVRPDIPPYLSPVTGKEIAGRRARTEDLRRHGYMEWEPGIREQIDKKRKEIVQKDEKFLNDSVDTVIRDLNASGRLGNAF